MSAKQLTRSTPSEHKLGPWKATAICGNDITSSCLYVSALSLLWGGAWGPIALLLVAAVLWLFRGIYSEVVGALPLNGGAYNALLNTTSKKIASVAACLTILSYLATAVISAYEAVHYAVDAAVSQGADISLQGMVMTLTITLLGAFAYLTIRGIGESAIVALGIFIFHMSCLTLLCFTAGIYLWSVGLGTLYANWGLPPPKANTMPLFLGFCVAMLGISGFESSANYVEEQEDGVFPITLRNMWIAVSIFNPLICFLALAVVPLGDIGTYQHSFLAHLGREVGSVGGAWLGEALSILISIDAALVLSGAVLTSFVGVTGLIHRMTLDRCLPQFLLKRSRYNTFYPVIISFFLLSSLLLYLAKDVNRLAGVYTISFLSVMLLFCIGNACLKIYRSSLPRNTRVSWFTIIIAGLGVTIGLLGNLYKDPEYLKIFLIYFVPTVLLVFAMLERTVLLKICIYTIRSLVGSVFLLSRRLTDLMEEKLQSVNAQEVVFFTRGDNIANLNNAILYVRNNEHTNRVKVVTVVQKKEDVPEGLAHDLAFLNKAYPEIDIEFVIKEGVFTPALLKELGDEWNIPLNFMFIGSPGDRFPHNLASLGGVRLII